MWFFGLRIRKSISRLPKVESADICSGIKHVSKRREDMYPYIGTAVRNAKAQVTRNEGKTPAESAPGTEMYKLVEKLKLCLLEKWAFAGESSGAQKTSCMNEISTTSQTLCKSPVWYRIKAPHRRLYLVKKNRTRKKILVEKRFVNCWKWKISAAWVTWHLESVQGDHAELMENSLEAELNLTSKNGQ